MTRTRLWQATGLIALANAAALGLQFITTILIARQFGTSIPMDAYTLAVSIPEALQVLLLLASLSVIFTPLFIDAQTKYGEAEAWSMAFSLFVIVLGIVAVLIPLLLWLMPELMYLMAPGFAPSTRALAVELSNLILPGVFYYATAGLLLGICYAYRDFTTPALNTLLLALLNLVAFFVFVRFLQWDVRGMIIGRLCVLAVLELFLLWRVWRHKHHIVLRLNVTNPRAWHLLTYLPPYLFGAVSWQVELFITRSLISTLGAGSVAAWGYGQRIADIPMALLGAALGATYLPDFATNVAAKNQPAANAQWSRAVLQILFVLTPISALLIALGAPLIGLLFQRGAFDALATQHSAAVLAGLVLGLPLRGVGGLIVRGMPAFKTRALPLTLSAISTGTTILFALTLVSSLGLFGVALAASLGDTFFALVGTGVFWRWLRASRWASDLAEGAKILAASLGAGVVTSFAAHAVGLLNGVNELAARFIQISVSTLLGLAVFVLLIVILRVKTSRAVFALLTVQLQTLRARAQMLRAGVR